MPTGVNPTADNILAQKAINERKGMRRSLQIYTLREGGARTVAKILKNVAGEVALVFHAVKHNDRRMDCANKLSKDIFYNFNLGKTMTCC